MRHFSLGSVPAFVTPAAADRRLFLGTKTGIVALGPR